MLPNHYINKLITNKNLEGDITRLATAKGIPEEFLDPISLQLMRDPVIVIESQQTYERRNITEWFGNSRKDPVTGKQLSSIHFIDNVFARNVIGTFLEEVAKKQPLQTTEEAHAKKQNYNQLETTAENQPPIAPVIFARTTQEATSTYNERRHQQTLEKLEILKNQIIDPNQSLKQITLECCNLTNEEISEIFYLFALHPEKAALINKIDLSNSCNFTSINIPSIFTNLERLSLGNCEDLVELYVQPLPKLEVIYLEHARKIAGFDLNMLDHLPKTQKITCCHGTAFSREFNEALQVKINSICSTNPERKIYTWRYHGA